MALPTPDHRTEVPEAQIDSVEFDSDAYSHVIVFPSTEAESTDDPLTETEAVVTTTAHASQQQQMQCYDVRTFGALTSYAQENSASELLES